MIMRIEDFERMIDDFIEEFRGQDFIIVMAAGYTEKELDNAPYMIEYLEYDGNDNIYCWLHDWNEGQQYIRVWDVFPEKRLLWILTGGVYGE